MIILKLIISANIVIVFVLFAFHQNSNLISIITQGQIQL